MGGRRRVAQLHRKQHGELQPAIRKLQPRLDRGRRQRGTHPAFHLVVLILDPRAVRCIHGLHGFEDQITDGRNIGVAIQLRDELMPGILRARHLFVDRRSRLEQH